MSFALRLLAFGLLITASIPYFHYYRDVQGSGADHQQYLVIDSGVCEHSRIDFGDLRLYAEQNEVPYALSIERGSSQSERKNVQVLQPGTVSGKTEFFLDMAGLSQYDRIELQLKARDFVSKVRIDGQDDLHGSHWATLANTIVYDLSDDHLGNNTTLRLPLTTYRYLRISMEGPVKPAEVQGATAEVREEEKEVWRTISNQPQQGQHGKDTIFMFSLPKNVSVERLVFTIDSTQPNFKREVELQSEHDVPLAEGEISRVHMVRHGQKIDSEQTEIDTAGISSTVLKVIVHNGDDRPLQINAVQLEQYERRIYFNSSLAPHLYYGDEKLQAPEYDYAKLFQKDPQATPAQLGPEQMNAAYTGRPDDRPWSERHPAVLWAAIIAAVAILGGLALRSVKTMAGKDVRSS